MSRLLALSLLWLFVLGGLGAFFPFFSLYLRENAGLSGMQVGAVMSIPPLGEPATPYFEQLVELRALLAQQHPQLVEVSAGMTDDFEEAIRAGATTIRVGRAIFD